MKISEFIKKLQEYQDERGDLELVFSVRDYYSRYGCDATHFLGDNFYDNTMNNGKQVRFDISLQPQKDISNNCVKQPKITFRK
jgi:hypothetical protein